MEATDNIKRLLASDIVGIDINEIIVLPVLTENQQKELEQKIKRYESGIPLDWLLSLSTIDNFKMEILEGTFVPRPETIDWIHRLMIEHKSYFEKVDYIIELCTGSGIISMNIKRAFSNANIIAVDLPKHELVVERSQQLNQLDFQTFHLEKTPGEWMDYLYNYIREESGKAEPSYIIITNPPYLPTDHIDISIVHEPSEALYSGFDGLLFTRQLINWINTSDHVPELIAIELDPRNIRNAISILHTEYNWEIYDDVNNLERLLIFSK
jgi:HemK-like putative methylase